MIQSGCVLLIALMIGCLASNVTVELEGNDVQENLKSTIGALIRQVIELQFYVEEMTRSDGQSGIKAIRNYETGTRPHFVSIHNHANNIRTVGMGELIADLNGVEFRTRHNDYSLKMKCRECTEYGATVDIPFPEVPPSVKQDITLQAQIREMREYFKAWRDQDHSIRDYRPFFKPVLCYLEGSWTTSDSESLDDSVDSDGHFLDANSWHDLLDKIRFSSYADTKSNLENFAYLPISIIDVINDTIPVFAKWNYRILCHPVERDIPLSLLRVVDDIKTRMEYKMPFHELKSSTAARYQLNYADDIRQPWREQGGEWGLLDTLMAEIPGADNYGSDLVDSAFSVTAKPYQATDGEETLNTGFYHRFVKISKPRPMGLSSRHRGFNDDQLFMAMTNQSKVAGMHVEICREEKCTLEEQKWTYAVPLEIIYLTPLSKWNPFDLEYKGDAGSDLGKTVYGPEEMRNGSESHEGAFNGTNSKVYYLTPTEFFEEEHDPADTTKEVTYFLAGTDQLVGTKASGIRIFLPNITGVGELRQRYPIMPKHGESSAVWKELEALKDIVLEPSRYQHMFREDNAGGENQQPVGP